ncbi:Unknown protein, partial [Striga hermonthica]
GNIEVELKKDRLSSQPEHANAVTVIMAEDLKEEKEGPKELIQMEETPVNPLPERTLHRSLNPYRPKIPFPSRLLEEKDRTIIRDLHAMLAKANVKLSPPDSNSVSERAQTNTKTKVMRSGPSSQTSTPEQRVVMPITRVLRPRVPSCTATLFNRHVVLQLATTVTPGLRARFTDYHAAALAPRRGACSLRAVAAPPRC